MTQNSPREHMDKAVSRYSSLFTLPSYRKIITALFILCIIAGIATMLPFDLSLYSVAFSLSLGVILFFSTVLGDNLTVRFLLKKDLILNLRRCSFLSFSSNLILLIFAFIASLTSASFNDPELWIKITSFGAFASLSLRFLVFSSLSFLGSGRVFLSVLLQPALFLASLLITPLLYLGFQNYQLFLSFSYFIVATSTAFIGVYLFTTSLNSIGTKTFGIPSLRLFKAFLANWTEGLEKPFEEILEQLSEERSIKVSLLAFKTRQRLKAVIAVPNLHPGPFKNIGSSAIPSLIQESLEKKLECPVSVPHGISGHELDLASQAQNERVLKQILEAAEFNTFNPYATPFLSLKNGSVSAGCQVFEDCALLTLTLAPETMEDLPLELNNFVIRESKRRGFTWTVAIDAHNSIEGPFNADKVLEPIKRAVVDVLEKAVNCERSRFEVGVAKVVPREFGIKEGMGPGGINVTTVKVGNQKTAYVTIDGNNMVSGLREKILLSLQEMGIAGGEVLTTDTHIVNAVVMTGRGYYPIGEMIDHDLLIGHIKAAAAEALRNLEPAEVSCREEEVFGVKVIGERQINSLSLLVDEGAKKTKMNSLIIFPLLGILLTVLLVFL